MEKEIARYLVIELDETPIDVVIDCIGDAALATGINLHLRCVVTWSIQSAANSTTTQLDAHIKNTRLLLSLVAHALTSSQWLHANIFRPTYYLT